MFTPAVGSQQVIHESFVGILRSIVDEGLNLFWSRRQTSKIERNPANQRAAIRLRTRLQSSSLQLRQNELVNRIADPGLSLDGRHCLSNRWYERPMFFPSRALLNPTPKDVLLLGSQRFVRGHGRHPPGGIRFRNPLVDQTCLRVARDNWSTVFAGGKGALSCVETKVDQAGVLVRPVAMETSIG